MFYPGNTANHLDYWFSSSTNSFILECVSGVKLYFIGDPPFQGSVPEQYSIEPNRKDAMEEEVQILIRKGIVTLVEYHFMLFISNIFSRPKPNGRVRLIIDLTLVNEHLEKWHFKMDDLNTAIDLVRPGWYLGSLDLSDAYFTLPLHPSAKRFVNFLWDGKIYQYNALPFGVSSAPYVFTKVLKPIFSKFRLNGGIGFSYIDDCLVMASTPQECSRQLAFLANELTKAGFYINYEKSDLVPKKCLKFLGYLINTETMQVTPTDEKREKLLGLVSSFLGNHKRIKIRKAAALIGSLNDLCKGMEYGPSYIRRLEMNKYAALLKTRGSFDGYMYFNAGGVADLLWWKQNIPIGIRRIQSQAPQIEVFSDASLQGWGFVCDKGKTGKRWSQEEFIENINYLELKAILYGLQSFYDDVQDVKFSVKTDNTTAVAYVNRHGGTKSQVCNDVALDIWQWLQERNSWAFASHIPGVLNEDADYVSRHFTEDTEWELNDTIFAQIVQRWGHPSVDLFASQLNHKVLPFCSWYPDPKSKFVDAFSLNWSRFPLPYIFPPFRILGKVLRKMDAEGVSGIVVAPYWPGQFWFPLLQRQQQQFLVPKRDFNLIPNFINQEKSLQSCPLMVVYYSGN